MKNWLNSWSRLGWLLFAVALAAAALSTFLRHRSASQSEQVLVFGIYFAAQMLVWPIIMLLVRKYGGRPIPALPVLLTLGLAFAGAGIDRPWNDYWEMSQGREFARRIDIPSSHFFVPFWLVLWMSREPHKFAKFGANPDLEYLQQIPDNSKRSKRNHSAPAKPGEQS